MFQIVPLFFLFIYFQEAEKFKAMVDSLQKVLLQRCDKEGKTIQKFDFHLLLFEVVSEESIICKVWFTWSKVRVEL